MGSNRYIKAKGPSMTSKGPSLFMMDASIEVSIQLALSNTAYHSQSAILNSAIEHRSGQICCIDIDINNDDRG